MRIRRIQENADPKEVRDVMRDVSNLLCSGTFTWDPPNVPASTVVTTAITTSTTASVTGIVAGMPIVVTLPTAGVTAGIIVQGWASANNELTVSLTNITAAGINMGSATWGFLGFTS